MRMRYSRDDFWVIRILDTIVGIIAVIIILGFAFIVYIMDLVHMDGPPYKQV